KYIEQFAYNGTLKILLDIKMNIASIDLQHNLFNKHPNKVNKSDEIRAKIKNNIH
ncbi:19161_t:CDS:1, partial [Cetraspora pellucida]